MSQSPRAVRERFHAALISILVLLGLLASPASADWLVFLDGKLIEIRDTWFAEGKVLTYTDLEGQEHTVSVDLVDFEGSAETTAMKKGLPYEAPAKVIPPPLSGLVARQFPALGSPDRPPVILYATSWCGYCRKTRTLLKNLKVDYVEKNIEHDRAAAAEMAKKAGGRSGVPVLDIGGYILRGYSDRKIRRLVKDLRAAMKEQAKAAVGTETL